MSVDGFHPCTPRPGTLWFNTDDVKARAWWDGEWRKACDPALPQWLRDQVEAAETHMPAILVEDILAGRSVP